MCPAVGCLCLLELEVDDRNLDVGGVVLEREKGTLTLRTLYRVRGRDVSHDSVPE